MSVGDCTAVIFIISKEEVPSGLAVEVDGLCVREILVNLRKEEESR